MSTQTFLCDSLTLLLQGALAELQRLLRRAEEGDAWGGSEGQTPLRLHLRARAAISGRNADLCAGCEEEELCRALLDAAVKMLAVVTIYGGSAAIHASLPPKLVKRWLFSCLLYTSPSPRDRG
eukprot:89262-Rhodomonas_salina.1